MSVYSSRSHDSAHKQYVYLAEGLGPDVRLMKIGHSWNIKVRIGQLRRSMRLSEVRILGKKKYGFDEAVKIEKRLHEALREFAINPRSEWYWFNEQVIATWRSVCR